MNIHDSFPFQWLMVISDTFLCCHLKCIVWVLSLFFGEPSMLGHGAGIGYTGPGWAPLTISVWWRGHVKLLFSRHSYLDQNCAVCFQNCTFCVKLRVRTYAKNTDAIDGRNNCERIRNAIQRLDSEWFSVTSTAVLADWSNFFETQFNLLFGYWLCMHFNCDFDSKLILIAKVTVSVLGLWDLILHIILYVMTVTVFDIVRPVGPCSYV